MPPDSLSTRFEERMASSRVVLPWSTWPMMVTTGRARRELGGLLLGQLAHGLVEADELRVEVRRPGDGRGDLGVDELVEVGGEVLGGELLEKVLGPDLHGLGGVLEEPAFAEGDALPRLRRGRGRGGLGGGGRRGSRPVAARAAEAAGAPTAWPARPVYARPGPVPVSPAPRASAPGQARVLAGGAGGSCLTGAAGLAAGA